MITTTSSSARMVTIPESPMIMTTSESPMMVTIPESPMIMTTPSSPIRVTSAREPIDGDRESIDEGSMEMVDMGCLTYIVSIGNYSLNFLFFIDLLYV